MLRYRELQIFNHLLYVTSTTQFLTATSFTATRLLAFPLLQRNVGATLQDSDSLSIHFHEL